MPPDTKADPPGQPEPAPSSSADERLTAVETEQKRQGSILEQILDRLPGKAPGQPTQGPTGEPSGKSVAELVREGVEQLRADEAAQAERNAEKTQREDHAARLQALEERQPSETAATPAGKIRSAVQRWGFGIDDTRK